VGTNLASHFATRGAQVLVLDNLERTGVERNAAWLREVHGDRIVIRPGDVREPETVAAAMEDVDVVLHLAAQVAVTTSLRDPRDDFEVNALGTLNVLEAARARTRPPALIFTSTNKVYGDLVGLSLEEGRTRYRPADEADRSGITERRPLDFHSPYGCSKGAADQYVLDYARTWQLPAAVFRMSCIYGPHQHGTEDQGWVAHFLIRALRGEPMTIFGDGKQVRDILFVEDLVRAFERVLDRMDEVRGTAFNVGGGSPNATSLIELIEVIRALDGCDVDIAFDEWRTGDQRWYVSDTSRLTERTGWRPKVDVETGMRRLHAWLRSTRPELTPPSSRGRATQRKRTSTRATA
jgi:CDP-paratose 2-epimerase